VKNILKAIVQITSVPWIPRAARVARISGISNVAEVSKTFVYYHILVEFANVISGQSVRVRSIQLSDRCAVQSINIASSPKSHSVPA